MTEEKDPIIEMYLKKSWRGRVARLFMFTLIFLAIAAFGAYYYYGVSSEEKREEMRAAHPVIEKTAAYMDAQGWVPLAPEVAEAQQAEKQSKKEKPAVVVKYPDVIDETASVDQLTTQEQRAKQAKANADLERYAQMEERVKAGEVVDFGEFGSSASAQGIASSIDQGSTSLLNVSDIDPGFFSPKVQSITVANLDGSERVYKGEALSALRQLAHQRLARSKARFSDAMEKGGLPVFWKAWSADDRIKAEDFMGFPLFGSFEQSILSGRSSVNLATSGGPNGYHFFPYLDMTNSVMLMPELVPKFLEITQMEMDLAEIYARMMRQKFKSYASILIGPAGNHVPNTQEWNEEVLRKHSAFWVEIHQIERLFRQTQAKMGQDLNGPDAIQMVQHWRKDISDKLKQFEEFRWDVDWEKMRNSRQGEPIFYAAQLKERGGEGISPSEKKARRWYGYAVNLKHPEAANNMARMHLHGMGGLDRDPEKAFELLKRRVDEGEHKYLSALYFNLGIMYFHGWGTATDHEKAKELFDVAARKSTLGRNALDYLKNEALSQIDTASAGDVWRATND